jgi:uncharacterized protein with LGFP repeats
MTVLHTLLGRLMGRAGVALVMALAVIAFAPGIQIASASPEGDADVAMTQAWEAGGGPTGALGPKDGGVYAVGSGFGQNFASGRIYFTPETGARIMQGAILEKYLSLGGPGDGDLGFPNIDEGAGRAPNSRNTTFSAADNPVIFWTPDTGAHVVRGAINAAWDRLGGSAGTLGVPTEDEVYRGNVVSQTFTGGQISWDRSTKTFTTTPPELAAQLQGLEIPGNANTEIDAARRAAGGPLGPLGAAEGPPEPVGDDGLQQTFAGGKIFYRPATGATVITGQLLAKYESVGGPESDLGFPKANEADGGLAPASRVASFTAEDGPVIFWTPDFGAVIVRGAMNAAWAKLGGATGELGAPTADQTEDGDVVTQKFANGAISWNRSTGEFTTEPTNLAAGLAGLEVPGQGAPPAPQAADSDAEGAQPWYQKYWWALAVIPVLLLIAAIVAAVVRRRTDDREPLNHFDEYDDFDDDGDFESGPMPAADDRPAVGQPPNVPLSAWAMTVDDDQPSGPGSVPGSGAFPANFAEDQDAIDTAPTRVITAEDVARSDGTGDDVGDGAAAAAAPGTSSPDGTTPDATPDDTTPEDETPDDLTPNYTSDDGLAEGAGSERTSALTGIDPFASASEYRHSSFDDPETTALAMEPASGPPSGRHAAISMEESAPAQTSMRLALDSPFDAPDGYPIKADTKTGLYWLPGSGEYDRVRAEIWFASEEFALTNGFTRG